MGKEKSKRRLHPAAPQPGKKDSKTKTTESETMDVTMDDKASVISKKKAASVAPSKAGTNPFRGMKITKDNLKQVLPDFDAQSAVTSKTFQGLNLKKKDKRKLRHDLWMEKIDTIQKDKKEKKAKKKRQQTAVVGDMQILADALPTLELLHRTTPAYVLAREKNAKKKGIAKEKDRQRDMMKNIDLFKQVLKVDQFQANPTETILEHLRLKLKQEEAAAMDT